MNQTQVIHFELGNFLLVLKIGAEAKKMKVKLEEDILIDVKIDGVVCANLSPPVR